jgi:hypothetical protein
MDNQEAALRNTRLDEISTDWAIVRDPARFVMCYAPAIRRYLAVLIRNPDHGDEVAQDFFLAVAAHGFVRTRQAGGRFRDYVKAAVRNAALNFLHRRHPAKPSDSSLLEVATQKYQASADQEWLAEWRRCLLDRARRALKQHQARLPGNLFHTVLGMVVDNPLEDTKTLASRTSALIGRPLRAEAFRQQVSRARRTLVKFLLKEVARTLDDPTAENIQEELIELGLWNYVRAFLPAGRRPAGRTKEEASAPGPRSRPDPGRRRGW